MLGNKKWGGSTFYCNQRPTTNKQQQHNITRPPFPWDGKGGSKQQNKQTEAASTTKSSTPSATPRKTQ